MGIGSCYIGDILKNYEAVEDSLQLPDEIFPIAILRYGHYKQEHKKASRKRSDGRFVVFENSYRQLQKEEHEQTFAERAGKKSLTQNKYIVKSYAQQLYAKGTGAPFSKEMTRSVREALRVWTGK